MTSQFPDCLGSHLDQVVKLGQFVGLAFGGLGVATNATRILELRERTERERGKPIPEQEYSKEREQTEQVEAFGHEQDAKGFPYLYGLATVRLWGILESLVDDLAVFYLTDPSRFSAHSVVSNLKIPLIEFWNTKLDPIIKTARGLI